MADTPIEYKYVSQTGLQHLLSKLKTVIDTKSKVTAIQTQKSGTKVGTITIDGVGTDLYAPTPTTVSVTQTQTSGTKVGSVTIDGTATELYAPSPTSVSVTQTQKSGTKIGSVTINGTATDLYVPTATNVTVDSAMSDTSTNAIQNKVVKKYIDDAIGGITEIDIQTATSYANLPTTGTKGVIYLVPNSGSSPNAKDEYIWDGSAYEKIGTTDIDLSGYVQSSQLVAITNTEIDGFCKTAFPTVFTS